MATNPYRAHDGVNVLRSVVVYLDVLGVRAAIAPGTPTERQSDAATRFRSALDAALPSFRDPDFLDDGGPATAAISAFTDNIVVGVPIRGQYAEEGDLGSALMDVGEFQLQMVLAGFPVRGALAVGDLYLDDDMVWGSGLMAAYEAEQSLARDPRVVVTKDALRLIGQHLRYYGAVENSPHQRQIVIDWDAEPFVNYLDATEPDDGEGPDVQLLTRHRDVVVQGLQEHNGEPRVWPKYIWMAEYHNHFCDEHALHDARVPAELLVRRYARLSEVLPQLRR